MEQRDLHALLAWSALPFLGERALTALLDHAREAGVSPADLWETPPADLRRLAPIDRRACAALEASAAARWERAALELVQLRERGVDVLCAAEPDCPAALRAAHGFPGRPWPVLFAYGALGLLEEPRVAVVSSSTVSESALLATDSLADALARRDVPLVTSASRESYQAAATAAKRQAGPSVMVLDRSLAAFTGGSPREPVAAARVWDELLDPELQLLLSPFGWGETWTPRSGRRRDALVFALSDLVIAVDVRAGGTIERECRQALERGRSVAVLDRGAETPAGARRLWEAEPRAVRLTWRGAEDAARAAVALLPGRQASDGAARLREGWDREIAQFLARACRAVETRSARPRRGGLAAAAFPPAGVLASVAAQWSAPGGDRSAGVHWLLADLVSGKLCQPARLAELLGRVAAGGVLAAVVPAEWLRDSSLAGTRAGWLELAALRLAVKLPRQAAGEQGPAAAVLLLEKGGEAAGPAPAFSPDREMMGRFHLRRYLREVLGQL